MRRLCTSQMSFRRRRNLLNQAIGDYEYGEYTGHFLDE